MKRFMFAALLLVSAGFGTALAQQQVAPPTGLNIVMIGGESIMTGVVIPSPLPPVLGKTPSREFIYTMGGKWFSPIFESAHSKESKYGGSLFPTAFPVVATDGGPNLAFAEKWITLETGKLAIVPTARGGTRAVSHLPSASTATIFGASMGLVTRAKRQGTLIGILWSQGANDTRTAEDATHWSEHFQTIAAAWRTKLGDVPIVFTQLGDNPNDPAFPNWETVRNQQANAATKIPNSIMVKTLGLTTVDGIHYTPEAKQTLGQLFALALYSLRHK